MNHDTSIFLYRSLDTNVEAGMRIWEYKIYWQSDVCIELFTHSIFCFGMSGVLDNFCLKRSGQSSTNDQRPTANYSVFLNPNALVFVIRFR